MAAWQETGNLNDFPKQKRSLNGNVRSLCIKIGFESLPTFLENVILDLCVSVERLKERTTVLLGERIIFIFSINICMGKVKVKVVM